MGYEYDLSRLSPKNNAAEKIIPLINMQGKEVLVDIQELTPECKDMLGWALEKFFDVGAKNGKLDEAEAKKVYLDLGNPWLKDGKLTEEEVTIFVNILEFVNILDGDADEKRLEQYREKYKDPVGAIINFLAEKGKDSKISVPVLIKILKGEQIKILKEKPDSSLRSMAAAAVGRIGVVTDEAISALKEASTDKDDFVSTSAISALSELSVKSPNLVDFIIELFKNTNKKTSLMARKQAAYALGDMAHKGLAVKKIVSALVEILKTDEDQEIKEAIADMSLGKIGEPAAEEAVPAFIAILESKGEECEKEVAEMSSMKVRKVKTYKDIMLRKEIIVTLSKMGKKAKDAIPVLKKALKDKRYEFIKTGEEKDVIQKTLDILKAM